MNYSYLEPWFNEVMKRTNGRGAKFEYLFHPPYGKYDVVADMHGHTKTFSDGERSASFYKKTATQNQITHTAITDHDSIGKDDAPEGFINGVEITSLLGDNEIEILVLGYDQQKAQALIDSGVFPFLDRSYKINRNLELTKKRIAICNKLGLTDKPISLSDVLNIDYINDKGENEPLTLRQIGIDADNIIRPNTPIPKQAVYKGKLYPINYSFLIRKLFNCIHNSENGKKFLNSKANSDNNFNPDSPDDFMKTIIANKYGELHVETDEYWPTASESIEFARLTGGVAVLAHPFGYNKKINITSLELVKKLYDLGVDGIEVFHGFNQSDEVEFLYKFCYENGLLITMGSDTHGFISNQGGIVEPGIAPGVGHSMRYIDGNIDESSTSIYNLHYYGTGAWRGEKEFDYLSLPPTIKNVFETQEKNIKAKQANERKSKKQQESKENSQDLQKC